MRWQILNEARSAKLAIIISYPTSNYCFMKRSTNNYYCFIKKVHKISKILPDFIKTTDFRLVLNFEQMCTVTIFGEHSTYNGSYTMMAEPIRALELHYPMIQFLLKINTPYYSCAIGHIQSCHSITRNNCYFYMSEPT